MVNEWIKALKRKDLSDPILREQIRFVISTWAPLRHEFSFPDKSGDAGGLNPEVIIPILREFQRGAIKSDNFAIVMDQFIGLAPQRDWERWWRPVLTRTLKLPFGVLEAQEIAREPFLSLDFPRVQKLKTIPGRPMLIEPFAGETRFWILIAHGHVEVSTEQFGTRDHSIPLEVFDGFLRDPGVRDEPTVLEVWREREGMLVVTDMSPIRRAIGSTTLVERTIALQETFSRVNPPDDEIVMVDRFPLEPGASEEVLKDFRDAGYVKALLREPTGSMLHGIPYSYFFS